MPISGGSAGAHDDSMHQGTAKRDVAGGLAGLEGVGRIIAAGTGILIPRDVAERVWFKERTSDETMFYVERYATNNFVISLRTGAGWSRLLHNLDKDVVDGVAALGAAGQLLALGSDVELTRNGSENIEVVERTSGNVVYRWTRIGVNDFECRINCGGVACKMLNDSLIDAVNGIAGLDASGELTESVYTGIGQEYNISDALMHSHDAEADESSTSYAKIKTITINTLSPTPSTLRIKFDLRISLDSNNAYGKIYKNGAPVGTERVNATQSYVTHSEDLSFADGDTLELWGYVDIPGIMKVQNFRVYGDKHDITLAEAIVASDVGEPDCFVGANS